MDARSRLLRVARIAVYSATGMALSAGLSGPFTGMHSWRQIHNALIARNFIRHGFDPSLTLVDFGGGELLFGTNFSAVGYPTALIWSVLGQEHAAVPRMLALVVTLFAAWYLERLGRMVGGEWVGLGAAGLFLTVPVIASYGVGFFDDPVMIAGVNAAVFYAARWGRRPSVVAAALACVSLGIATAVKLPALYALLPMSVAAAVFSGRGLRGLLHRHLIWAVPLALGLSLAWYVVISWRAAHWPNVTMALDLKPGSGKFGDLSSIADPGNWVLLSKRINQEVAGYSGLLLAAMGVACLPRDRRALIPLAWCAAVGVYVLLVFRGHVAHDYYQMVFAAPLALLWACPLGTLEAKDADAATPAAASMRLNKAAPRQRRGAVRRTATKSRIRDCS